MVTAKIVRFITDNGRDLFDAGADAGLHAVNVLFNAIAYIFRDPVWSELFYVTVISISLYQWVPWKKVIFHVLKFLFSSIVPNVLSLVKSLRSILMSGLIATLTAWLSNSSKRAQEWDFYWVNDAVSWTLFAAACVSVVVFAYYTRRKIIAAVKWCLGVIRDEQNIIAMERKSYEKRSNTAA